MNIIERKYRNQIDDAIKGLSGEDTIYHLKELLVQTSLDGELAIGIEEVGLTPREASIYAFLVKNTGRIKTRDSIQSFLYAGLADEPELKIINVFICKLRKKLKLDPSLGEIESIWGHGYRHVYRELD